MIRGLYAQLSPHEEVTLRRIVLGDDISRLPEVHLRRLEQLRLIERHRTSWGLTPLGQQRYDALEKPPILKSAPPASGEIDRILG